MCDDPLLPEKPVYGGNNWYYAYGKSSRSEILGDCRYIASLCAGNENPPHMIIDDGWQCNVCSARGIAATTPSAIWVRWRRK